MSELSAQPECSILMEKRGLQKKTNLQTNVLRLFDKITVCLILDLCKPQHNRQHNRDTL